MKKTTIVLALSALSFTSALHAQDTSQLTRKPYKLSVIVDKQTVYQVDLKETPFIHYPDNTIQLYPGETLYVEIEQTNGVIKSMKAVSKIKDSSKTITLALTQTLKNKKHESMMLKVINPFPYELNYGAMMLLLNKQNWVPTDVYPVGAGLSGYELWPDVITSIGLAQWRFTK